MLLEEEDLAKLFDLIKQVWKIEKKSSHKQYAIKEISKVKLFEMNSISCVMNERRLLAHLRHPFIINMHYAFQEREHLYIVMDYKSGGDLRYHIHKKTRNFKEEEVKFFISCLLLALEYLHHNSIMHRDIKPENLVFDNKGYLFLTDLGIARLFIGEKQIIDNSGTIAYMAPEIITNQPHDLSSDFYSIGIMLYELIFEKRPYEGNCKKSMKEAILSKEIYIKYSDLPDGWSKECVDLINRLVKRKSESRIGKNGIQEIKSHLWFKDIDWVKLYNKELVSPFQIVSGENYDNDFVNSEDKIDRAHYDVILKTINKNKPFDQYYFNFYDPNKEKYFEYKGFFYKFQNLHDENELNSFHKKLEEGKKEPSTNKRKSLPSTMVNLNILENR